MKQNKIEHAHIWYTRNDELDTHIIYLSYKDL